MATAGRRWLRAVVITAIALLVVGAAFNTFYLADLRPDGLVEDSAEARAAGRVRLEELATAHGGETWRNYEVMDIRFEDVWHGALMQNVMMHWAESPQALRGRFTRGGWTGELELASGPDAGDRWGIQSWKTWRAEPGEKPEFVDDPVVEFVVPTTQYFLELPLRIQSATVVLEAGKAMWNDKNYDVVYATWESAEPRDDMDQYVVWIDPDTGLMARTDFTVRDHGGGAIGSAHYLNYEDFGGVQLAKRIEIFGLMPGGYALPVHTFVTDRVEWDGFPVDELRPDPTLVDEGEYKPDL